MANIVTNEAEKRFEAHADGKVAILRYRLQPGEIVLVHTEVPVALEGRGLGGQLAKAALDYARSNSLNVVPNCPFLAGYIKRHSEYLDLVPEEHRGRVSTAQ